MRSFIFVLFVAILASCVAVPAGKGSSKIFVRTRILMETVPVTITVRGGPHHEAVEAAFAEGSRLEGLFSTRLPSSEVSRINREAGLRPVTVSPETFDVLKRSLEISRLSRGSFDITFGSPRGSYRDVHLISHTSSVRFRRGGLKINIDGIAKGFIVDRMTEVLKRGGVTDGIVNAGGDLRVTGRGPEGPWTVKIQDPGRRRGESAAEYIIKEEAVSTSGLYERGPHIIDPGSHRPVLHEGMKSVTVFAPDATTSDALATAIWVMGREKGEVLIRSLKSEKIRVLFLP